MRRGARATGIEYRWNKRFLPNADDEAHIVRARRLVVISAGTFGSPGILERSGVGAAEVLAKNGVRKIVDLPGVGEAYQGESNGVLYFVDYECIDLTCIIDHPALFVTYVAASEAETLDAIIRNDPDEIERACFHFDCIPLHGHGSPSHVEPMAQGWPRPHGTLVRLWASYTIVRSNSMDLPFLLTQWY